jgi:outer membrane protein assembly factor BamB
MTRGCIVVGAVLAAGALASAGDWPQFRGPNNAGVAGTGDQSLPSEWSMDKNIAWKAAIPGVAWSSPIVWGDKVFVTTAITEKQTKPKPGMGGFGGFGGGPGGDGPGGGAGGPPGGGRPGGFGGGFGGPPQPGRILSPFVQQRLNLTDEQKKELEALQKEVDAALEKLLTDEQKKQLKEPAPGRPPSGFGGFPQPGQILSANQLESLKLSAEQKKQAEELQKDVDAKLAKLLKEEQSKQLKEMRQMFGGGFGGPGGPGGGRGGFGGMGAMGGGKPPDAIYRWEVYCLDKATGKVIWKQLAAEKKPAVPIHPTNTYASETPITDGERIYAYFGMTGLYCFDMSGKPLWKKELGAYPMMFGFGPGASPALEGDRIFVQCDNEEKSFLVALDKKTGDELWRAERNAKSSWTTPFVWRSKSRTEVVACGGERVQSYDPASGKVLWEVSGLRGQWSATPVATEEMLFVGAGGPMSNGPLYAIRAGAMGDLTLKENETSNAGVAWSRTRAGLGLASPLLYEGHLYILAQNGGIVNCFSAKTGEEAYKQRIPGAKGFTSSPWAANGKIYCLDEDGKTYILQPGAEYKLLGQNKLDEMFWSTPAIAEGVLLLRGVDHLYCIRQ